MQELNIALIFTDITMNKPKEIKVGQLWKFIGNIDVFSVKVLAIHTVCDFEVKVIETNCSDYRPINYTFNTDFSSYKWYYLGEITASQISYGSICQKCKEFNSYAESKPNFICYGCSH